MNRWKAYVWMAAGLMALSAIAAYTAKPLWAQIKAALVQNIDEPGRNPYSSFVLLTNTDCVQLPPVQQCTIPFDPVPSGKRLVVTNITGNILVATPGVVIDLDLFGKLSGNLIGDTQVHVPTFLQAGVFEGSNLIGVNSQLAAYYSPGSTPSVFLRATTPFTIEDSALTISGYLVSLP